MQSGEEGRFCEGGDEDCGSVEKAGKSEREVTIGKAVRVGVGTVKRFGQVVAGGQWSGKELSKSTAQALSRARDSLWSIGAQGTPGH